MKSLARLLLALAVAALLAACAQSPQPSQPKSGGKTEVLWLGQSAFRITTPGGKVIVTDPWLKLNPLTPAEYKNLEALGKVDVLLVTHGHFDHFADAPALALLNQVPMYAPGDMNQTVGVLGILPPNLVPRFNKSGTINPVPGIKVTAVHAEHSSVIVWKNPATGKDEVHPGGEPVGYIIELENGFRIYHMGDTGLFADMKFIADYYKPDLVLMPIGGHFTMDPVDAAYATREWLKPRAVIPMHYGANPLGKGTPDEYIRALGSTSTRVLALKPGEKAIF
ncbi:metal-dependent hydrolase [Variovorax paradoxus]|uniref:metal-dependent hydrolase n=1 Tax=Variovorax paradoxus TaxID=34073 RepID=UPI0021AC2F19|nr:metal-dependent hydrolase [Variovorax paradoxus]UVH55074.1 metal-dependent hydrolase [Variovorax paradoxus]